MPTEQVLNKLIINKVDSSETLKSMKNAGLLNETELYLVEEDEEASGGAQVSADWAQNDENAKDYVKNRTHWTETILMTSIENETLTFPSEESGDDYVELSVEPFPVFDYDTLEDNPPLYRVTWDGVEYECHLYEAGEGVHLGGFDDGYPFRVSGPNDCYVYAYDENGDYDYGSTHTLTVAAVTETVHKLDPKYLPDMVVNVESGDPYHADKTFAEIRAALMAGQRVVLNYYGSIYSCVYYDQYSDCISFTYAKAHLDGHGVYSFHIYDDETVEYAETDITGWDEMTDYVNRKVANVPTKDEMNAAITAAIESAIGAAIGGSY